MYDYNRDKLVNATDQIIARNNRTSPFTALKLITPPLEDDGSGEGEGEWSGDVWTSWIDSSLFDTHAPLNESTPQAAVVPFITTSDLLRVPLSTSVTQLIRQVATMSRRTPAAAEDWVPQDPSGGLSTLPVALSAPIVADMVDMSVVTTTSRRDRDDLFLPLMNSSPEGRRMGARLPQLSDAQRHISFMAWSQSVMADRCPVGPVKDEQSHNLAGRIHWAADSHGRNQQRAPDEALQELLAEWEQF